MTAKVTFNFKGLMAPVFTAFHDDKRKTVNLNQIAPYAEYLKKNGVDGVLVNGTSGEGMSLSVEERKQTAERWQKVANELKITTMIQIGGAPYADVIELAIHAESIKVDSILCLPELYFKPKTEEELVKYLKDISEFCPTTPLLYYHIPWMSGVNLNMPRFLGLAEKEIPNFVGLKYTSGDLEQGTACLKPGRSVFLGADTILCAAVAIGFDSSIMTTLNFCPELSLEIMKHVRENRLQEARQLQEALTKRVQKILENGEWVPAMKLEFNKVHPPTMDSGPVRLVKKL
ncbi:N-acetylneuraminate lyase A [Pseudolycoriella hygida]|uniref:N-acetylneuraminate lyase n=1 Tax=Pseudolycoriella hygida TaxID=35572 RepID=A0A9Q0RYJ1_9DIPT|nr:N-acetylneuraminate lyase A [Pseudolycoriella hygida]